MKQLLRGAALVMFGALVAIQAGCSMVHTWGEAPKRDTNILRPGIERDRMRAEFGTNGGSLVVAKEGKTLEDNYDVFRFPKGSGGFKYLRATVYGVMDVGTLGLAEFVSNPVERGLVEGGDAVVRVRYDRGNRAVRAEEISNPDVSKVLFDQSRAAPAQPDQAPPASSSPPE
jgi:hypothetical protein